MTSKKGAKEEAKKNNQFGQEGRPIRSFENSRCHRKPAKAPKEPPRRPQEHPKWAQESSKTPSRASLDPKPWFFENRAPASIKPWFLRVGGSAWELKFDTKRLQDEENNDFEEGSERRDGKNNKFDQARSKKEVLNLRSYFFDSFLPSRAPERPPRGWGSAAGYYAWPCGKTAIFEKKCARASAAAHFSKMRRETSG